ncbi:catecholate siderophore receptor Fiu [Pseudoxanthomonas dokdonensis]|uniref:Catecholate siderophore receptor Fiu n=1 Tax=Pseudoxanthomonas dokdonensis TaxID=344882 RepID=A0A0R0CQ45_9GAMM|nr:catecholate siderophore receptor Fiu [Pseudoxanthomonas dokdonensis]KRG67998.1 catecholate siderophore receptor Fiu [Pseudoxanthomonas dokdonensis]
MSLIKSRKHASSGLATASLLTGLALALPTVAQANDDANTDATTLPQLQVKGVNGYGAERLSSPKFTRSLLDTTQTINVFSSELFNQQGATTLTEVLRNSPGVGTFYAGENGNTTTGDSIYMRGFDASSSIFVDGVRDLGSISRDVFNIEQVEVTKGPSGPDNGRTSPTGAINMVSKQPQLRNHSSAGVSVGSDDQKRVTADWNQTLGAQTGSAFRLNAMWQDSDVPGRDVVNNKRWGIAPSLAFGLDGATRFYINLLHVDQDNVPDGAVPTIGLPGYTSPDPAYPQIGEAPRVDSSNFYGTLSDYDDVTADMATLRLEHDFNERLRLHNITRWGKTRQDYMLTAYRLNAPTIPDPDDIDSWTFARSLPTFKNQQNTIITNQFNITALFDTGRVEHSLSSGVELTREKLETTGMAALDGSTWPDVNLYHPDPDVSGLVWGPTGAHSEGQTDTASIYAFDTMKFNEFFELNAGLRLERYETEYRSTVACGGRGAPTCGTLPAGTIVPGVDADDSDTLFNWKVGALFKPSRDVSVYANYAISLQPPGGSSLELSSSANNANNPNFDPQEARTAEIGSKWNLLGEKLLLSTAIYRTELTNEIVQDPIDALYYQTGRKRVQGIEISAVGRLTDNWSLSTGYTTMDARVVEGSTITADGTNQLTYTPDKAFTAWTTYAFPSGLTVGGGARYSGPMKRGSDGAIGTPAYTEDYWVLDAVVSYAFSSNFDLRLNAYNLLDEDYVASINKSGYRYNPGAPRSLLLTADFRF